MQNFSQFCLSASIIISMFSCEPEPDSIIKITNGKETESNPEVVQLMDDTGEGCTGTFVSSTTLITAAHCLDYGLLSFGKIKATKMIAHPSWKNDKSVENSGDIAVVIFPEKTAPDVAKLAETSVKPGDKLTIIGFGMNDTVTEKGSGKKRIGTNVIKEVSNGFIKFQGESGAGEGSGENSVSGSGDSGGPLYIDNLLAGVTSSGSIDESSKTKAYSWYVDLSSTKSKEFLRQTVEQGADIPNIGAASKKNAKDETKDDTKTESSDTELNKNQSESF